MACIFNYMGKRKKGKANTPFFFFFNPPEMPRISKQNIYVLLHVHTRTFAISLGQPYTR